MDKEFLKKKLDKNTSVRGFATLVPPANVDALQSSSSMAVLDLISEGPIYGLINSEGKSVNNINILESLFLDETPVKPSETQEIQFTGLPVNNIQLVGRLEKDQIQSGFENISGELEAFSGFNSNNKNFRDTRLSDLQNELQQVKNFLDSPSNLGRYGFIQYKYSGIYETGDLIFSRGQTGSNAQTYLSTFFDIDAYLGEQKVRRVIQDEDSQNLLIPKPFSYSYQVLNDAMLYDSGAPNRLDVGIDGKVGYKYLTSGFAGGGIIFFDLGDYSGDVNSDTGRFFVSNTDPDLDDKINSGRLSGYDVFVHDGDTFCLSNSTPNQIEPSIGETNGLQLNIGLQSDLDSVYNFSNIAFDFRNGFEFQPPMVGYQEAFQDFDIRKKLYGPLSYEGDTKLGAGSGFLDDRVGGEFSDWMIQPPLEHDAYPYTHTIKRISVKRAIPTVSIESLFDTVDNGDDAGVQKAERLDLRYTYGFEGGVAGDVGTLLSGGNTIQQVAMGTFQVSETQQFEGIVLSNYLNSFSSIGDLPRNKSLRGLRVDAADVPGLTSALLDEFDLTSGDLIFPGEEWKKPNRFLKAEKISFETNSTLVSRECSMSYVTEVIGEDFTYPFAALAGTTFDARNFVTQPTRQFLIRGRNVMIPSNYSPLRPDGSDKRFANYSERYGIRNVQTFNGSTYARSIDPISLGTQNCEFLLKFKVGSFTNFSRIFDARDVSQDIISLYIRNGDLRLMVRDNAESENYFDQDINSYLNTNNIFEISAKLVGSRVTFTVFVNGVNIGGVTETESRRSFDIVADGLGIGATVQGTNFASNGTKIVDFKIKQNNQLLHHWDGTIINTKRSGNCMKDRFGGNHAKIIGTTNAVEDTNFEFGKNKEQVYIGQWDGTFKLAWTDNPAWILYDLMTNPVYGIGNNIDNREDINIFNLYEIGKHCDAVDEDGYFEGVQDSTVGIEPRFSCNLRLYENKNAFEVIGNLASVFRGFTYWDGLGLNFAIDKKKDITAIFNNGNVFDGVFNYADISSSARFTRVEVNYADANDSFTQKVEYVEDEERIRQYGLVTNTLNGIGCTSKSQARRMGKYVLLSNKIETEVVKFGAGIEAIFLEPGDIIRIDDETRHFEINYGRVLDIQTGAPNPYVDIPDSVNIDSIETGINGGLYMYNDRQQDELKNLYDVIKYKTAYTFGEDSDIYSGVLSNGIIERQTAERITKFTITGKQSSTNTTRLFLETGDSNYQYLTGVQRGTFFNVELTNQVDTNFKVIKKSQVEPNIFEIEALQYESEKFDQIENDDFDVDESTYNIGILQNTINRPSAPTVQSNVFQENNLTYSITGLITAAPSSNETSYRVVLYRTNQSGPYIQKEFLRESDDTTFFKLYGLVDGNYTIQVAALRNPESSQNFKDSFLIKPLLDVYSHNIISNISLEEESGSSYERLSGSGFGVGSTIDGDVTYNLSFKDKKNREYSVERFNEQTVDVYGLSGDSYKFIKSGHGLDSYTFTEFKNNNTFGSFQTGFKLKFELKESGTVIDSAFHETTII